MTGVTTEVNESRKYDNSINYVPLYVFLVHSDVKVQQFEIATQQLMTFVAAVDQQVH